MNMPYFVNNSFVLSGIDKITLGIESRYLNYYKSSDELKHIIDIIQYGNWIELNIQLEIEGQSCINPYFPLLSIMQAIQIGISHCLFKEPLSSQLLFIINSIYNGMLDPYSFLAFFNSGIFKFDEYELYFDFYGYNPFIEFDKTKYNCFLNSVYTKDYKVIKWSNGVKKGIRRSILCFYDRGMKLKSMYTIHRLEFRICDYRAKVIIDPIDLFYSVPQFIYQHSMQIKKTLKRYLPDGSIVLDKSYIFQNIPILSKLIWLLE